MSSIHCIPCFSFTMTFDISCFKVKCKFVFRSIVAKILAITISNFTCIYAMINTKNCDPCRWPWLSIFPDSREKERNLTHSYDKSPYTDRKILTATWQNKNATKNFDYTTIANRLKVKRNLCLCPLRAHYWQELFHTSHAYTPWWPLSISTDGFDLTFTIISFIVKCKGVYRVSTAKRSLLSTLHYLFALYYFMK